MPAATNSSLVSAVIVLAAGAGTRMKSTLPKVLHPIAGKPLVWHALSAAAALHPQHLVAVLGHGRDRVEEFLAGAADLPPITVAVQDVQNGTGHATACALREIPSDLSGVVIVSYGDVPLLRAETLAALANEHAAAGNAVTVLTATVDDPTGYGRITRDGDGALTGIVEHKDADETQRAITEINSGVYAFDAEVLIDALPRVGTSNAQGEQYLTDVVGLARGDGRAIGTHHAGDPIETEGVNDRVQLATLARVLNDRLIRQHQLAGVTVIDPATTWVHADVTIGADTVLLPGTLLEAGTQIGAGCRIGPDTTVSACVVGDDTTITRAHCVNSQIGDGVAIGPYASLREHVVMHNHSKAGTFVELKKSTIGENAKVPHLTYLGDVSVGARTNVGAGVISANYDGVHKFPTRIGDDCFVGSHSTLIAPVTLADGSFVATGSSVSDDVPAGALAVARARQYNSEGWVLRKRDGTRMAETARAAGAQDRVLPLDSAGPGSTPSPTPASTSDAGSDTLEENATTEGPGA